MKTKPKIFAGDNEPVIKPTSDSSKGIEKINNKKHQRMALGVPSTTKATCPPLVEKAEVATWSLAAVVFISFFSETATIEPQSYSRPNPSRFAG